MVENFLHLAILEREHPINRPYTKVMVVFLIFWILSMSSLEMLLPYIRWIAVMKDRIATRLHKDEISGFRQQTPDSIQTFESTQSFLDVLGNMIRDDELVVQNDAGSPTTHCQC